MKTQTQEDERLQFIRLLYRNESGVSDHVSPSRLKELNIKTNLDDVVRKAVRAGSSVVVTGNASSRSLRRRRSSREFTNRLLTSRWASAGQRIVAMPPP